LSEASEDSKDLVPFTHLPGEKPEKSEVIDLDFDYYDTRPSDYQAFRNFLTQFLNDDKFDAADLATIISEQTSIGTTVKNGDGGTDPLAFLTAINLYQHKDRNSVKQILEFLVENCKGELKNRLGTLLDAEKSQKVGLLIQDRLKNVAPELIPPLHTQFMQDLAWAAENEDENIKPLINFEHFILISHCATMPQQLEGGKKNEEKKETRNCGIFIILLHLSDFRRFCVL